MKSLFTVFCLVVVFPFLAFGGEQGKVLLLGFGDKTSWDIHEDKPYWAHVDIRDMLNIFHPMVVSQTGNWAGASREITVPSGWNGAIVLRFYCSDNYYASQDKHKPGQLGTESFFEHRYKQVLLNDKVIWEVDVIDENMIGTPTIFEVDVTEHVKAGEKYKLTFRLIDKVTTLERNSKDVWFIGGTWYTGGDGKTEREPKFHTQAWFADVVLGPKTAVDATPLGSRPHEAITAARHKARWPMPLRYDSKLTSPAELELVVPGNVPEFGTPVTCGIPVPPGMLTDAKKVKLIGADGKEYPLQTKTIGTWIDGSIRWLLVDTIVTSGDDKFKLYFNETHAEIKNVVRVNRDSQSAVIDTGKVRIKVGLDKSELINAVYLNGNTVPVMKHLRPRMSVMLDGNKKAVNSMLKRIKVVESGPVAACVELQGSLDTTETHIGSYVFRIYAYAGLPTIQTQFRFFNEAQIAKEGPLEISDMALISYCPLGENPTIRLGVVDGDTIESASSVTLHQKSDKEFTVGETKGKHSSGWINVAGSEGALQASVWRLWEQYPKSLGFADGRLEIGLFTSSEAMEFYKPYFGEAKRHDIWLTFSKKAISSDDQKSLSLLADYPAHLFDGKWFCGSGSMALLDDKFLENNPIIKGHMDNIFGDRDNFTSDEFRSKPRGGYYSVYPGIRNYGDVVSGYGKKGGGKEKEDGKRRWYNGRWASVQVPLYWGISGCGQGWFGRGFESARHVVDVDCAHIPRKDADWKTINGMVASLWTLDHSMHRERDSWPAFQLGEQFILHYWMTGDLDSLDAALANADYLIRNNYPGRGSTSMRNNARPMLTLLRAWQATDKKKYKTAAGKYFDLDFYKGKTLDWRRGIFIQPTYQNWRVVASGLSSMYGHNVYDYYRLTGDLDAAQTVVAIADGIYAESMLPQEESIGDIIHYVRYGRTATYNEQIAMLFYMAYDLTEDIRFLRAGRAAYRRHLLCGWRPQCVVGGFSWINTEIAGWEREFADVKTKPFNITKEVSDPDPANFKDDVDQEKTKQK